MALIASGDLDDQTVYKIIDVIHRNQNLLKRSHPALASFAVGKVKTLAGLKLHPGAAKYFKDN